VHSSSEFAEIKLALPLGHVRSGSWQRVHERVLPSGCRLQVGSDSPASTARSTLVGWPRQRSCLPVFGFRKLLKTFQEFFDHVANQPLEETWHLAKM
jgi:hypothetical protein